MGGLPRRLRNIEVPREGLIKEPEQAADAGDSRKYVELMGGNCLGLKDRPLRALMAPKPTENKYHETVEQLKGLKGPPDESLPGFSSGRSDEPGQLRMTF